MFLPEKPSILPHSDISNDHQRTYERRQSPRTASYYSGRVCTNSHLFSCWLAGLGYVPRYNGTVHVLTIALCPDIPTFKRHIVKIASAGVGLVISGSMGEANHLAPAERIALIRAAREALDNASPSLAHVPIIAGTGTGSTKQTIELTRDAYEAGADYAIVIASGFFAGVIANDRAALKSFWSDVATASPLPIFIYNCA